MRLLTSAVGAFMGSAPLGRWLAVGVLLAAMAAGQAGGAVPAAALVLPEEGDWMGRLRARSAGETVGFLLPEGESLLGAIDQVRNEGDRVVHASGRVVGAEAGRFLVQSQTRADGSEGAIAILEFPRSRRAYRLEPAGAGDGWYWVARRLDEVRCVDLPQPTEEGGPGSATPPPPLNPGDAPEWPRPLYQNGVPVYQSLPGAGAVLYLDFQGGQTWTWGGIEYERSLFTDAEIREIWERVAEDFLPFKLNVTTDRRAFEHALRGGRQRVIITPTDAAAPGAGGVAYTGSFNWTEETPCWVFVTANARYCAQAVAHELGHTLGLGHCGVDAGGVRSEYFAGHGAGEVGWAPIMGLGYYRTVTQWSRGEYEGANNDQDQLRVLGSRDHVAWREDDTGGGPGEARWLEIYADGRAWAEGLIEFTGDRDAYRFTTRGGWVALRAGPVSRGPDLAVDVTLRAASGQVLADDHPADSLWASLATNLPAGDYLLEVVGSGRNDPFTNGFSAYASLGYFVVTGVVAQAAVPERFEIPEHAPVGTRLGELSAGDPARDTLRFTLVSGNEHGLLALDGNGGLTVADADRLDFEALTRDTQRTAQVELWVQVYRSGEPPAWGELRRVVVTVSDVNEPPQLRRFSTGGAGMYCFTDDCHFPVSVVEGTPTGTVLGRLTGSDPDTFAALTYHLLAGNERGAFELDADTGELRVAGELVASTQAAYTLAVGVSDGAEPAPLMATATVHVSVRLPFPSGGIGRATYPGIAGDGMSALTNASWFPRDPSEVGVLPRFESTTTDADRRGVVLRGYLLPPATGDYTFWIAGRDWAELWLSPTTNAEAMTLVARVGEAGQGTAPGDWDRYPSQTSAAVPLAVGRAYAIEARLLTGGTNGHVAVAWSCATAGMTREVISGPHLAPRDLNFVPHPVGFAASVHRNAVAESRLGSVGVTDLNADDRVSFRIVAGNEEGVFSLDAHSGVLRVADPVALASAARDHCALVVEVADAGAPPLTGQTVVDLTLLAPGAFGDGRLLRELWTDLGTSPAVASLTGEARYPARPDQLRALADWSLSDAAGETNGGSRVRAYLTPVETGLYTFHIASDAESQLKFSHEGVPTSATIVAWVEGATGPEEWHRMPSQSSGGQWLEAGARYYLEALHKQGSGASHLAVGWSGPGIDGTNVLPAAVLSPVDLNHPPTLSGVMFPISSSATNGALVAALTGLDSPLDTLTYALVSGNIGGTFRLDPDTGRLWVADATLLNRYAYSNFNLTVQVQDSGYGDRFPRRSADASLIVPLIDNRPAFAWVGGGGDDRWSTPANWTPGVAQEGGELTFAGVNHRTNRNDLLRQAGLVRFVAGGFVIEGNPITLSGGLTSGGDTTWRLDTTLGRAQSITALNRTLTWAGALHNPGYDLTLTVGDTMRLDGVLSGAGRVIKTGPGQLVLTASNVFAGDVVVNAGRMVVRDSGGIGGSGAVILGDGVTLDVQAHQGEFVVPAGRTLSGLGAVRGAVRIDGVLAPESPARFASGLNFQPRLTLAGQTVLPVRLSGGLLAPALRVQGTLVCGGRLTVRAVEPSAFLTPGNTFRLFEAVSAVGAFDELDLPPLRDGLRWDVSRLQTDGTLRVALVPPDLLPVSVVGGSLLLRFPTALGQNYVVEAAERLDPEALWIQVTTRAGSGTLATVWAPIPPTGQSRFFRVRAP